MTEDRTEAAFQSRPDLVFRRGAVVVAIADTKWKLVSVDRRRRLLPAETDLYQMHAYATAFSCQELALVYPWHVGLPRAVPSEISLPTAPDRTPVLRANCIDVYCDDLELVLGKWHWV